MALAAVRLISSDRWLAAAYAEAGRFQEAVSTIGQALALAEKSGQTNLLQGLSSRLGLFRRGLPYREP